VQRLRTLGFGQAHYVEDVVGLGECDDDDDDEDVDVVPSMAPFPVLIPRRAAGRCNPDANARRRTPVQLASSFQR